MYPASSVQSGSFMELQRGGDASRYMRKGPDDQAALAAMLMDLYIEEEEDFARQQYWDGFSMYNPIDWVGLGIQHLFYHWVH